MLKKIISGCALFTATALTADIVQVKTVPAWKIGTNSELMTNSQEVVDAVALVSTNFTVSYVSKSVVQSDWAISDTSSKAYIKNKPSIPAGQMQSDWAISDTSSKAYIKNKPSLAMVATSGQYNDLSGKPSIPAAQVQSDWLIGDSASKAYIKNKPNLYTNIAINVEGNVFSLKEGTNVVWSSSGSGGGVQSDWAETNARSPAFIKNKPSVSSSSIGFGTSNMVLRVTNNQETVSGISYIASKSGSQGIVKVDDATTISFGSMGNIIFGGAIDSEGFLKRGESLEKRIVDIDIQNERNSDKWNYATNQYVVANGMKDFVDKGISNFRIASSNGEFFDAYILYVNTNGVTSISFQHDEGVSVYATGGGEMTAGNTYCIHVFDLSKNKMMAEIGVVSIQPDDDISGNYSVFDFVRLPSYETEQFEVWFNSEATGSVSYGGYKKTISGATHLTFPRLLSSSSEYEVDRMIIKGSNITQIRMGDADYDHPLMFDYIATGQGVARIDFDGYVSTRRFKHLGSSPIKVDISWWGVPSFGSEMGVYEKWAAMGFDYDFHNLDLSNRAGIFSIEGYVGTLDSYGDTKITFPDSFGHIQTLTFQDFHNIKCDSSFLNNSFAYELKWLYGMDNIISGDTATIPNASSWTSMDIDMFDNVKTIDLPAATMANINGAYYVENFKLKNDLNYGVFYNDYSVTNIVAKYGDFLNVTKDALYMNWMYVGAASGKLTIQWGKPGTASRNSSFYGLGVEQSNFPYDNTIFMNPIIRCEEITVSSLKSDSRYPFGAYTNVTFVCSDGNAVPTIPEYYANVSNFMPEAVWPYIPQPNSSSARKIAYETIPTNNCYMIKLQKEVK